LFSLPKLNKILALLTVGILVTLIGALKLAGWYIRHHFHYTGKGSRFLLPELVVYTPTLVLALTLLLTLLFRHWLWHVLFFLTLAAQIVFRYWLFQLVHSISGPVLGPDSLVDYLDYLPLFGDIACVIVYSVYRRYDYEGAS
jgi:hypothetical protein